MNNPQNYNEMDERWGSYPRVFQGGQNDIGIIKEFSRDLSIPDEVRKAFWGFIASEVIWSNFNKEDESDWDNILHIAFEKTKAAIPYFEYTPEMDMVFTNIKAAVWRKIMRARGPDRERVLLATEIQERRYSQTAPERPPGRISRAKGWVGRILGG